LAGHPANGAASSPNPQGGRQAPAPYVTKLSDVEIPFTVRSGTTPQTQPTAIRVFVSWDRGKTWHFYEEIRPEAARFRFRARQDGEFWFATQTIDRSGKPDNAEPRSPQLKLVIDSQKPQLVMQAQVDAASNVNLAWSAADPTLLPATLKIEYQDAANTGGNWETLELRSTANAAAPAQVSGQISFHPAASMQAINLRAEIADSAGNMAYYTQHLSLAPAKPKPGSGLAAAPAPDPSARRWPANNTPLESTTTSQLAANQRSMSPSPASEQVGTPSAIDNPFVGPGRLASTSAKSQTTGEELPLPAASAPASQLLTNVPSRADLPATLPSPVANPPAPGTAAEIMPAPRQSESVETPSGQRPRLTNSRRFSLDYDVQTVGPEGLEAVELWGTTDGGRAWTKWGVDPDKASPFDVEVNHEAIYGFRIVIVGKNGLATSTPQPGDSADIWVGIDLTRPQARLTGASYGQGDAAGKLDIRWEASDSNLGSRPITLSIGDRPDGAFTPIAAGLPNTGQYYWEYDPRSPRQIFLRLEVRDEAANIAIDQLTEPIKVEGLEPKGQIRGFNPGPENIRGAFRTPLFR
jgi:hypothetical protein